MKIKSKSNLFHKAACLALTGAMCVTFAAGQFVSHTSAVSASTDGSDSTSYGLNFNNANGTVNLTDVKFSNFSDKVFEVGTTTTSNASQTIIVGLEGASIVEGGDIDKINAQRKAFLKELSANGIEYELKYSYTNAMNGVAITVPLSSLATIRSIDGVSSVSLSTTYYHPTEVEDSGSTGQTNYSKIYANGIYDSSEYVANGIDGAGMTVAILDTGLDYTHDAFNPANMEDQYAFGSMTLDTVRETFENKELMAEKLSGSSAEDVYINQKVPFAYDYADYDSDVYASYSQHGTHVAGIVAGKTNEHYTDKDGNDSGYSFVGVAPEAQLVICKVFTDNLDSPDLGGAKAEDIMAALDDCVALGVDVINMSLGTSAGFSSEALRISENIKGIDTEGEELNRVFESIRNSGISLMVAASNDFSAGYGSQFGTNLASNPDSGTVGSPSTYDGAMSVASVNGQMANYMLANATEGDGGSAIYYEESRNEDSDAYNFLDDMLGKVGEPGSVTSATFKYVVVPGYGDTTDYTKTVRDALADKQPGEKVIAIVKRGGNGLTFKKKIQTAKSRGADAVIVYNNVSGMIRMSLEDLQDRIPAVSVSIDAGELLTGTGSSKRLTGYITLSRNYQAGPFMNDYSSWGVTPDLQLKPDVTSHGGEIISTVAGGYEEMSGTSMACPNLAGFTALLKGYLKSNYSSLWQGANDTESAVNLANLTNNIMMSTATTVYDQNKLPYSPRKQGAGLATMDNVFSTQAYLYTKLTSDKTDKEYMCADGRPKAELGEDEAKTGVYNIVFYVNNFGATDLKFKTKSIFMTETLSKDGLSVAEKAYLFDSKGEWKADGKSVAEGGEITVPAGTSNYKIEVTLKLSASEKKYLDDTFKNGMFVEGFLQLESLTDGQCSLSLPFMGFYGDWEAAPLLDYNCFEIAKFDKDTSLTYETRPKESIWATQAYSYYWNEKYATPLGSFLYVQDPDKEHTSEWVYTEEEHVAISGFNEYYGESENTNYCTTTGIRALYAGLLRNAEIVTYTLTNVDTGEIIPDENGNLVREIYRARKAHSSGGSAVPSQVLMEMRTDEMNFDGNGKYRLDYSFYFSSEDYANGVETDDTFSMSFYVDYEAPILEDARIRYVDMKDSSGKTTQKIYLDLDVFDNHYTQAIILCYSETTDNDGTNIEALRLATEYITPVLNPKKNATNTVSIDVTDFYEEYAGNLFVEVQDYAMNYNVYVIEPNHAEGGSCPSDWSVSPTLSVDKNSTAKVTINNIGKANASNFEWFSYDESVAMVKNGEVFGVAPGTTTVSVSGGGKSAEITVTVNDSTKKLSTPSVSFGTMLNSEYNPVKAEGIVEVNPAQQISLSINVEPWYYPVNGLTFTWTSSNDEYATVDEYGNISVLYEGEDIKSVTITAQCNEYASCKATVTLSIQDPFTVSGGTLTRYRGWGGVLNEDGVRVLTIPSDKSITSIGEEAFKDVQTVEIVIIPKLVTSIAQRAFKNCTNLKKICFISEEAKPIADSSLSMIYRTAFDGCINLETVDLSNCKVITLDRDAFSGCTGLKEVVKMTAIGTAYTNAFKGCTSLAEADLSGLHMVGDAVFEGCTSLSSIKTGNFTAFGEGMFNGCTSLKYDLETGDEGIVINNAVIPANAFSGCTSLTKVTFTATDVNIGASAFYGCSSLKDVVVAEGASVSNVGNKAFGHCFNLDVPALQAQLKDATMGYNVFEMLDTVTEQIVDVVVDGQVVGKKLVTAESKITDENYLVDKGITEIGTYAFASSILDGITTLNLSGVTAIGKGAFYGLNLTTIDLPADLTAIEAYTFAESGLTAVTIPAGVTKIGNYAFAGCEELTSLTFAAGCTLEEIGGAAFRNTKIAGELVIPASVAKIGNFAFSECNGITAVTIPAVKEMGEGVFMNCIRLESATFGDEATSTGTYTFYAYDESSFTKVQSSLTSVTLGEKITRLGRGVFTYCTMLEEIDLKNVTVIADEAFAGCSKLTTVTGIDKVTYFGKNAFAEAGLTKLTLTAAKTIGERSFYKNAALAEVTFSGALESIGNEAFAGSTLKTIAIPENCNSIGYSAFSGQASYAGTIVPCFNSYTVDENNTTYFAKDGVLYEYIGGKKESGNTYVLVAYPDNKKATADENGTLTYTVIDNTVSIGKYAFGSILSSKVQKVVLPYTLKTIGHGAFYGSGISTFEFHSINAPTMLEDLIIVNGVVQRPLYGGYSSNSLFYLNILGGIANYAPQYPGDTEYKAVENTLTINYPSNGVGYDNYIYTYYFGTKVVLAEMLEDDTRTLIAMLEALSDASTVAGWNTSNKTKAEVEEFSAAVKQAHSYKNKLSETQTALIEAELLAKLTDVEAALKPVKAAFGIPVSISTCAIGAGSDYKTAYKVGEIFKLDGLVVKVTYDDYSEELVEALGNFVLSESYNRPLQATDNLVELTGVGAYEGARVSVRGLTVSESTPSDDEGSGFPAWAIIVIVVGVCVVIAAAVTIAIIAVKVSKKKSASAQAQDGAAEMTNGDNPADNQAAQEEEAVLVHEEQNADDKATAEGTQSTDEGKDND